MEIIRSALVLFPADYMYRLVEDVAHYPEFLSWCTASRVIESSTDRQIASLEIAIAGLRQTFTTRNELVPGESIRMQLLEGPFQQLAGEWRFEPIGPAGSKVILQLGFEFSGNLLSSAFRHGFASVADRLVNDFSRRAEAVYAAAAQQ
jgi:ribosome-associated toxin RatA of RatAB toxin-antitoxin module